MTGELPQPLVCIDVDLRDFTFMPLDVLRLRDSDLAATDAEIFRASVISWCVSWHQLPAASLPADDTALARLMGFGRDVKGWKKLRGQGALRGWVACSDGRLYHPVVVEKAKEAWQAKVDRKARTEAARLAKKKLLHPQSQPLSQTATSDAADSVTEPVTTSKGQDRDRDRDRDRDKTGTGQGYVFGSGATHGGSPERAPADLGALQATYPKFTGRQDWLTALHHCQALIDRQYATWEQLIDAAGRYAAYCQAGGVSGPQFVLTPAKFFGGADRPWCQPWDPPPTKAQLQQDSDIAAGQEWLATGASHDRR